MIYKFIAWLFSCICLISLRSASIAHDNLAYLRYIYSQPSSVWPKPFITHNTNWQELEAISNRESPLSDKAALGQRLFFETRLSSDKKISCASCHHPEHGFADKRRISTGVDGRQGKRNSISLLHLQVKQAQYFWDGRAHSL